MKKLIITFLIISALGALAGCSNTDSSISVTTPDTTSVTTTTTTTTASATSQSEETTTTTTTSATETQMPTETSQTEGETSSNTESVSSVQESSSATTTTTDETEATKPAVTTTSTQGTTSKATTTTKKQTTTTKATTTKPAETTQSKVTTTTTASDPKIGNYRYVSSNSYLYSKSDTTSEPVCMLAAHTKVFVEAKENGLYKIVTNEKKLVGYMEGFLLKSSLYGEAKVNTIEDMSLYDDECFRLLNEHRKELGLSELKYSSDIQKAADIRAEEIAEVFDHIRPNGEKYYTVFDELGIDYSKGKTEIICTGANLPQDAFDAWLESPGHYQHMISEKYTAAACGRYNGQWVIMFITE